MPASDAANLEEIGFRSLDFSELALRVEDEIGEELNFDAPELRQIATVSRRARLPRAAPGRVTCEPAGCSRRQPATGSSPGGHRPTGASSSRWTCPPAAAVLVDDNHDAARAVWAARDDGARGARGLAHPRHARARRRPACRRVWPSSTASR